MKESNWNIVTNSQLKEELTRLETEFKLKQDEMGKIVLKIDELHNSMNELSKTYVEIKDILDKREGKKR